MKKKLAFVCGKGLESFIEPIVQEFEKFPAYQLRRYYANSQQEIIAAVKWADYVFLEWANEIAIEATKIYDLKKKGVILRLHSYEAFTNMPQHIDWTMIDYLVFVAPHIRDIVKIYIPDIQKRVSTKVVYNGVDIDTIEMNEDLNMHNIAYVCNINHKKEPVMALQIMAELVKQDSNYKLHVAGAFQDNRYKIYMEYMAKEMCIADNILYYGFVEDMNTFWEGKGVILSTSIHEGHPYNIMEGAARGLRPVIHNFKGAKKLYPISWLFNDIDMAVKSIGGIYLNKEYRQYVINQGWTRANQVKQLKALVDRLGKRKKK